jgi:hypothetical protein
LNGVTDTTEAEANKWISDYRALMKQWTMCTVGLRSGDSDAMARELHQGESMLLEIAATFPAKAYSVDLLVNARKRTWAGFESERPARA